MATYVGVLPECSLRRAIVVILVIVGTNPYSFKRLISKMDELAKEQSWDVFIQLGNSVDFPEHCRWEHFVDKDKMLRLIDEAEVVVCHGGFGSIRDVLASGKTPVVVPRMPDRNESIDHQVEITKELEEAGRIIAVYDIEGLQNAIQRAPSFKSNGVGPTQIPEIIQTYLNSF